MLICILLDALHYDYIDRDNTPLLFNLKCQGCFGTLVPLFGFEPDAGYVAGLYPEESDSGMHFWFSPRTSPFHFIKRWGLLADRFPHDIQLFLRLLIRIRMRFSGTSRGIKYNAYPAEIPFSVLPYFDVVHSKLPFEDGFCPKPTIYDICRQHDKKWLYIGYPVSKSSAHSVYRQLANTLLKDVDFLFLFIADLDPVGHRWGPNSTEIKKTLKEVDNWVGKIFNIVIQQRKDVCLIIFGDHGMVEVKGLLNIQKSLDKLSCKPWKDYAYFLDSTFARFWFYNRKAKDEITKMLMKVKYGKVLTDADKRRYRINYKHNKFGDLIFWADGGNLIFPNFYQSRKPVRGMHGYREEVRDNHSAFILYDIFKQYGITFEEPVAMVDMFPTILELMKLPVPDGSNGVSLLRRI